jgi:hypothetical protein
MIVLPQNIVDRMDADDREIYARAAGKASAGWTSTETREKAKQRDEKALQKQIADFLRINRVEFVCPPMNKRSSLPVGWPDFTLCYQGTPLAFECKAWGERPRPEQNQRIQAMRDNGWVVLVVHQLQDVQEVFRAIDKLKNPTTTPHGAPAPADQGEAGR